MRASSTAVVGSSDVLIRRKPKNATRALLAAAPALGGDPSRTADAKAIAFVENMSSPSRETDLTISASTPAANARPRARGVCRQRNPRAVAAPRLSPTWALIHGRCDRNIDPI